MDEETLGRVFDFFSQASLDRSREGLGLGLALTRGLVELHGGDLSARSDGPGRGTEFTIRLPPADAPESVERAVAAPKAVVRSYRILIIEDNEDMAESMRTLLELIGHDVRTAGTGVAGVETARRFRPEVVLCDIGLPGGMSGHDVARALRRDATTASAYLVAVSGYAADEDQRRALKSGFDVHLSKPIRLDDLEGVLADRTQDELVRSAAPPAPASRDRAPRRSRHSASSPKSNRRRNRKRPPAK
jgi:CheY-like chemotaxis protein